MASKGAEGNERVTRGTGNAFADLGFPDAAVRQATLRLAYVLNQVLERVNSRTPMRPRCWA